MIARILLAGVAIVLLSGDIPTRADAEKPAAEAKTGRIEGRVFPLPEIRLTDEQKLTDQQKGGPALAGADEEEILDVRVRTIKLYERGSGQVKAEAEVGEDGVFVFEEAPAGAVMLSPVFHVGVTLAALHVPATVRAGETTKVAFFGKGRPLVGKVELPQGVKAETVRIKLSLVANPFRQLGKPDGKFHQRVDWRIFEQLAIKPESGPLDKDGQFRIEGVREGIYRISADGTHTSGAISMLFDGHAKPGYPYIEHGKFTVPLMAGGESDQPHHLGTLQFKLPEPK